MRRRPLLGLAALPLAVAASDRIVRPPPLRRFASPSGRFVLQIATPDGGRHAHAAMALHEAGAVPRPLWQAALPHERGPRHVLVTDGGETVLVDEWINVPSRHALTLLSPAGETLAHYDFDALVALLGVPRRTVADHARLGIWLSAAPAVDRRTVRLPAAGRVLVLQLDDGTLVPAD